jgi:hypothetical protein
MVPLPRLARWLAASMPRARPETMTKPAAPRSRASRSAKRRPAAEALRAPTTATAAHGQERRGVVDHLQPARIFRLSERDESDAERLRRLELALAVVAGMDAGGAARAAAAGKTGERRQRRAGAAVMVDQRAEGARADIVAADEAKPIEPLLLAQPHALAVFAHG